MGHKRISNKRIKQMLDDVFPNENPEEEVVDKAQNDQEDVFEANNDE